MKQVTAAEANRNFSRIMKDAEAGETIIVTSHGEPTVKIVAVNHVQAMSDVERTRREALWAQHNERLLGQPTLNLGRFERDWAYDE
jgi:prevent-host-death family protein